MPVVTISRQLGAGGGEVARLVAAQLGADLVDAEVASEVARRLQVPEEAVKRWDERREGVILRLLRALQTAHPEFALGSPATADVLPAVAEPDRIWETTQEVIRESARSGNAVIVGRGGTFILAGWPGVTGFRLVASRDYRIRRIRSLQGCPEEEASRQIDVSDRERERVIRHRFATDPFDPTHYAMIFNTGILGLERTAKIIVQVAREAAAS